MREGPLREILKKLDVDVAHKNARGWLVGHCPLAPYLHDGGTDHSPSFYVKVEDQGVSAFNCYTCKNHGNMGRLIGMLEYHRGAEYSKLQVEAFLAETPKSFSEFGELASGDDNPLDPVDATIYERMYPPAWEVPSARTYLRRRGATRTAAELLTLRFDPDAKRILFPVMNYDSELFGFTGRTILPEEQWPRNERPPYSKVKDYAGLQKRRLLLGEHLAAEGRPFLVVEGLFALLHVISLGAADWCNPVAVMGSWLGPEQRDILVDWDEPVFLLFDDDAGGDAGLYGPVDEKTNEHKGGGAIDMLRESVPTFRCIYPDDVSDPDDLTLEQLERMTKHGGDLREVC